MKKIRLLWLCLLFLFIDNCFAYNAAPVDITKMDVYEIQDAIDDGYLTYENLIKLYLDRIKVYDDNYNAIISINEDALKEAKKCDEEYKKYGRSSLLFGIPIIVKDNIDVKGLPTTGGSKALSDSFPKEDASVIKKLKDKGMIVIAKSNMSEFAFQAESSTSYYGTTKNAYNLKYSSYGSSGGSAVAVATSYAPVALGTDTNSSLRAPASANSVIGFRSTFNLIDTKGMIGYDMTRDVVGPITKTVRDNVLLLETMANKKYSDLSNNNLKNKNIVVLDQFAYGDENLKVSGTEKTNDEVKKLFNKALEKMEKEGANIIHLKEFYTKEYYDITQKTLGGWTMCYSFNNYIKSTTSKIKSFEELVNQKENTYNLHDYLQDCNRSITTIKEKNNLKASYSDYIKSIINKYHVDAFVYPTVKNKLSKLNDNIFNSSSYAISPVLGYPSVSMPLGFDSDNLSYGIEFVTYKNKEQELYNIISSYEKINQVYKLPTIAPSLYSVSKEVENLKTIYEKDKNRYIILNNNEKQYLKKIKNFFLNYNNYDNKSEKATKLYNDYTNIKIKNYKKYIFYCSVGVGILFIANIALIINYRRKTQII